MSLQKNMRLAIGVDVGGSHVCSAVVSLATGEIAGCVSETPLDSGADAAAILDILSSNILQSLEPVEDGTVEGVGLAFPGPFDYPNGISKVNGVGKYERIYGLDLKTSLSSRLRSHGMDSFRFLNDASAFALGECAEKRDTVPGEGRKHNQFRGICTCSAEKDVQAFLFRGLGRAQPSQEDAYAGH